MKGKRRRQGRAASASTDRKNGDQSEQRSRNQRNRKKGKRLKNPTVTDSRAWFPASSWSFTYSSPSSSVSFASWFHFDRRVYMMKQEIRNMLCYARSSSELMLAIDCVQKLDVEHHFEEEIVAALESLYSESYADQLHRRVNTLHEAALLFRLLRQTRYPVSSGDY
ncbi:hypothetical protein ZIOFF_070213 [Zingiber officinale]|uniref:Terpene synthase N-terminal domain-containing protein n=1 Tax=Zingiber officinale TaxID=94328 RepID=A0A8J5CWJ6_ZINOF|nr:hypothetical protein ZIOFF_070213 [Zingiber officinale]